MRGKLPITIVALTALALPALASERVTLRNGFEMRCDHHAQIEGQVRLYLTPGEDNYIEFPPGEITAVELVPDSANAPGSLIATPATTLAASPTAALSPADLHEMLLKAGNDHNLDVDLLASVVKAESGGNARAISRAGARGLMQLMPGTAAELGVEDSFKPEQNVRGGTVYLDALLTRYHDNLSLALAAYNAGPQAVDKYRGIPPFSETRAYVARVIHEFNRRVHARQAAAKLPSLSASLPPDNGTR